MRIGKYYNNVQGKCYQEELMSKFQVPKAKFQRNNQD
jgi:hypothetical protein